jgi:hypothetical protein
VEGELGVANFLVNFFKDCGVSLWLVWLRRIPRCMNTKAENEADQSWHHPINQHQLYSYDGIKPGTLDMS